MLGFKDLRWPGVCRRSTSVLFAFAKFVVVVLEERRGGLLSEFWGHGQ